MMESLGSKKIGDKEWAYPLSEQDIIEIFYEYFYVQERPKCVSEQGYCRYYPTQPEQVGCAFGCLFPTDTQKYLDDCYFNSPVPDFYGDRSDRDEEIIWSYLQQEVGGVRDMFLIALQQTHDSSRDKLVKQSVGEWWDKKSLKVRITEICKRFNLSTDFMETAGA